MRHTTIHPKRWLLLGALAGPLLLGGCAPATGAVKSPTAIATSTPTATPLPTGATSGPAGSLAASVRRALGKQATQVTAAYDAQKRTATITIIVGDTLPNTDAKVAAAYAQIKTICYQTFRTVWTSGIALREATALIEGPIQDEYANIITDWYGVAVIESTTAQRLDWANESPDSAWRTYGQHMLRSSFVLFD
jgi:hypothetical protein